MNLKKAYKKKKILITGGSGMIGLNLIDQLKKFDCDIKVVSIDSYKRIKKFLPRDVEFQKLDLMEKKNCIKATKGIDYVFHLTALKGNTQKKLNDISRTFTSFILCNTNMINAAYENNIKKFLLVGSIGQYPPQKKRFEDNVWNGLPIANDKYMGIAKRTAEIMAEALYKEHGWDAIKIVRLSNVYGYYDKFHPTDSHVIPSLIKRIDSGEYPLKVAGNGTAKRDFIFGCDVVDGMIKALVFAPPCYPINLGSGKGVSIKYLAETLLEIFGKEKKIIWKSNMPTGDDVRILDNKRAIKILNYKTKTSLKNGLIKTINWYKQNKKN